MTRHRPCPVGLKRPSIYRKDVAFPSNRRGFDGQAPIIRLRQGPVCCPARPKSGISENDAHRAHDGVFQTKAQGVCPTDSGLLAARGDPRFAQGFGVRASALTPTFAKASADGPARAVWRNGMPVSTAGVRNDARGLHSRRGF